VYLGYLLVTRVRGLKTSVNTAARMTPALIMERRDIPPVTACKKAALTKTSRNQPHLNSALKEYLLRNRTWGSREKPGPRVYGRYL